MARAGKPDLKTTTTVYGFALNQHKQTGKGVLLAIVTSRRDDVVREGTQRSSSSCGLRVPRVAQVQGLGNETQMWVGEIEREGFVGKWFLEGSTGMEKAVILYWI